MQEKPLKCCFTVDKDDAGPFQLKYKKGEMVWVISQDTPRYIENVLKLGSQCTVLLLKINKYYEIY